MPCYLEPSRHLLVLVHSHRLNDLVFFVISCTYSRKYRMSVNNKFSRQQFNCLFYFQNKPVLGRIILSLVDIVLATWTEANFDIIEMFKITLNKHDLDSIVIICGKKRVGILQSSRIVMTWKVKLSLHNNAACFGGRGRS